MESNHMYELTEIEPTAVFSLNGKIFIPKQYETLSLDGIISTSFIRALRAPKQQYGAL
jgi:hypothetical protein